MMNGIEYDTVDPTLNSLVCVQFSINFLEVKIGGAIFTVKIEMKIDRKITSRHKGKNLHVNNTPFARERLFAQF
jgi:hypothetical protein